MSRFKGLLEYNSDCGASSDDGDVVYLETRGAADEWPPLPAAAAAAAVKVKSEFDETGRSRVPSPVPPPLPANRRAGAKSALGIVKPYPQGSHSAQLVQVESDALFARALSRAGDENVESDGDSDASSAAAGMRGAAAAAAQVKPAAARAASQVKPDAKSARTLGNEGDSDSDSSSSSSSSAATEGGDDDDDSDSDGGFKSNSPSGIRDVAKKPRAQPKWAVATNFFKVGDPDSDIRQYLSDHYSADGSEWTKGQSYMMKTGANDHVSQC